jgi:lipopolysaccharide/colanic/teichoic acid biosynthesis glycosyltransferase
VSLDELPQIWNVLCGEMSLVGPRPIVRAEIAKYGDCFELYQKVRPGLTGLWQVSGRNNTTYQQRVAFDEYYVRNWSVWLDLHIFIRTIRTVLLGEGAY